MLSAINTSPRNSFIDHIAPLASLLNIPLLISDEKNWEISTRYYPELQVEYWPDLEFRLHELTERFDGLISCDYWNDTQKAAFHFANPKKRVQLIFCPHGQSDKGYQSRCLDLYASQEVVLLYGSLMQKMLEELNLWSLNFKTIVVGNFRRSYYEKHKELLLKRVDEEIFSQLRAENRTLLYAPTWNDEEGSGTFFEWGERLLKELPSDWNLVVKLHPDLKHHEPALFYRLALIEEKRPNFLVVTEFPLVYPILERVDAYLGDYSSIGYDFLSFGKPMFFLQKPHLKKAKLHTCGHLIDPSEPIFSCIEEKMAQDGPFSRLRRELYNEAFSPIQKLPLAFEIFQ